MFIENAWYVAGWSEEIGSQLTPRLLLNRPIVLYRRADGTPVALEDSCPHRNLPLSVGRLVEDQIQCAYHGLRFNHEGSCVHVPGEKTLPGRPVVRSYPVAERHGWVFVWMGAAPAKEELLPRFHHRLIDENWNNVHGSMVLNCGYRLILDNLLDLSHVAFVHSSTNGTPEVAEKADLQTTSKDQSVRVTRVMRDVPPAPAFKSIGGYSDNIDRWQVTNFHAPSFIHIVNGSRPTAPVAPTSAELNTVAHWGFEVYWALTPETDRSTRGYWASVFRRTDVSEANVEAFRRNTMLILQEDVTLYDAQQRAIDLRAAGAEQDITSGIGLRADEGLVRARAIIQRLHLKENKMRDQAAVASR
jgi:phenylpropionate dioxygenase-like ring-hydroxylating dioxygenase large terminal subunit